MTRIVRGRALLLAAVLFVTGPIRPADAAVDFAFDARVAYDLSRLDFARLDGPGAGDWAVFKVTLVSEISLEFDVQQKAYQRLREAATPYPVKATSLTALAGTDPDGTYLASVEFRDRGMFRHGPVYERFYEAFWSSARPSAFTAVCRIGEGPAGAVLADAYLIPSGWVDQVKPALDQWRADRAAFLDAKPEKNLERLRELAHAANPILAVLAYRALAGAGQLEPADLTEADLAATDARGVVAGFVLLRNAPAGAAAQWADARGRQVDAAKSADELYGLAVACALDLATVKQPTQDLDAIAARPSFRLLKRIEAKAAELRGGGADKPEEYLEQALSPARSVEHLIQFRDRRERARRNR